MSDEPEIEKMLALLKFDRQKLADWLAEYFDIGDSYFYALTRCKSAFGYGTVSIDDFVEIDDNQMFDIADFLIMKFSSQTS